MSTKSRWLSIGQGGQAWVRVLADRSSAMQAIVSYVVKARGGIRVAAFRRWARRLARYGWTLASSDHRSNRKFLLVAYAALLAAGIYTAEAKDRQVARSGELIAFDIPRQSLAGALQAYGQATGIQVLYESNSAVGRTSAAVEGKFTADAALDLLLKETELKVRYIRPDAITLALPSAEGVNYTPPATPLASSSLSLGTLRVRGTRDDAAGLQDFSQRLQMDIQNALRKNPRTRDGSYRAVLRQRTSPQAAKEESRSATGLCGNTLPFRGSKKQIASIAPSVGNDDICLANQQIGRAMDRLRYEPFGERLAPEGDAALASRASKYLLWAGTGLFWSLVGAIVIARAVFFEPGVFDDFSRVAALVKAAIF